MDSIAKIVGQVVMQCAETLVEHHTDESKSEKENVEALGAIGSVFIVQGSMLMLDAGCPEDIVISCVVACVESFKSRQLQEEAEAAPKIIL